MTKKVRVTPLGAPTAASLILGPPLDQLVEIARKKLMKPIVVCIAASTKFKTQILGLTQRETLNGKIVLNHGFFHHVDMVPITDEKKDELDTLMFRKIDLADEILVVDINGYKGRSTIAAIEYAQAKHKRIRYWSAEEANRKRRQEARREADHGKTG